MTFADLTQHASDWLRVAGPMDDVVVSSRVRLARNLAGMPFLSRCTEAQQHEIEQRLRRSILDAHLAPEVFYVDVAAASELDRHLLVERHLISRQHGAVEHPRGVAISANETMSIMINEEDHLRVQVLRGGLDLDESFAECDRLDDALESHLDFAFHSRYGYLTACPTNVGTGLRVSVMLHLPALKMTGTIEKVFRAAQEMHLAIRGLYGEGTEATGDFFQLSNHTTLGKTEGQIVAEFRDQIVPAIIEYERKARTGLLNKQPAAVDDRIRRSLATLHSAVLMTSDEAMSLLSMVRLGANLGRLADVDLETVNELFLLIQPAHLQKIHNRQMEPQQRDKCRADYLRRRLGTN